MEETSCFKLLDGYSRSQHDCFLAEMFPDAAGTNYTLCFRPTGGSKDSPAQATNARTASLRVDRKSSIVLEAVALEATSREDASPEAEKKGCQFFVLTTLLDPSRGPGISGGPDGVQPAPVIIGNANPNHALAIEFTILEVGTPRTLAEGTSTAPVEDNDDIRAADEAMRLVAHRVASELRKDHPPNFD